MNPVYIGLGAWNNLSWTNRLYARSGGGEILAQYARFFNAVEGNVSFHGLPRKNVLLNWRRLTPEHFRFFFKFPRAVTHEKKLRGVRSDVSAFLSRLSAIDDRIGTLMIQLPPSFSPGHIQSLADLLQGLPTDFHYAVELRHPGFYTQRMASVLPLIDAGLCSLVTLDARAHKSQEAPQRGRPQSDGDRSQKVLTPLEVGAYPVIRFIGTVMGGNTALLKQWVRTFEAWLSEGRNPAFFAHTETDDQAPELAMQFHTELASSGLMNPSPPLKPQKSQMDLFDA